MSDGRPYPPDWLDEDGAAATLSIPVGAFRELMRRGKMPSGSTIGITRLWNRIAIQEAAKALSEAIAEAANAPTFVYFIACQDMVKIGFTNSIKTRLRTLQCGLPFDLALLGFHVGDSDAERRLHRQFKHLHVRGEWFHLTGEIRDYVRRHCVNE